MQWLLHLMNDGALTRFWGVTAGHLGGGRGRY